MTQRDKTLHDIMNCLNMPEGEQWRSAHIELIARVEFELYSTAADITAYSDVSTLRRRLDELVADGVILQTQLKENFSTDTVAATATVPRSTSDATAAAKRALQQLWRAAYGESTEPCTPAVGSRSQNVQQQEQQQQQQQMHTVPLLQFRFSDTHAVKALRWHEDFHVPIRMAMLQIWQEDWVSAAKDAILVLESESSTIAAGLEVHMYHDADSLSAYKGDRVMAEAIKHCAAFFESKQAASDQLTEAALGLQHKPRRHEYLMHVTKKAVAQALADTADQQQQEQQQLHDDTLQAPVPQSVSSSRRARIAHLIEVAAAELSANSSDAPQNAHTRDTAAAAVCTEAVLTTTGTPDDVAVQPAACSTTTSNAAAADEICKCSAPAADSSASNAVSSSNAFEASRGSNSSAAIQQQQQQQQHVAAATTTLAAAVAGTKVAGNAGTFLIGGNWHTVQTDGTDNVSSSTVIDSSDSAHVTVPVVQHDSVGASATVESANSTTSGSDMSNTCITNAISCITSSDSSSSDSSESKWVRLTTKLLQSEYQRMTDAAVAVDSTDELNTSKRGSDHSTDSNATSRCKTTNNDSSSENQHDSSLTKQLLALQAQRVVAARQHAAATAATAATAAAAVAEANARVAQLQDRCETAAAEAALVAAAEAAAVTAIEAYSSHSLACKLLQIELHNQREQLLCLSHAEQHSATTTADGVTAVLVHDDSDSDDDCPPLARVDSSQPSNITQTVTATEPVEAAVPTSCSNNNSSGSSSDCRSSSSSDHTTTDSIASDGQQHKEQQSKQLAQPCVHCGKMTKMRCKRCQAVCYCSEECQIQCFKDLEHRAQCEAVATAAAAAAAGVAPKC
jgi:hypothetical protein